MARMPVEIDVTLHLDFAAGNPYSNYEPNGEPDMRTFMDELRAALGRTLLGNGVSLVDDEWENVTHHNERPRAPLVEEPR